MNPMTTPGRVTHDAIDTAAQAATPRDAIAALYPDWGLVADGGNQPGFHHAIVHRDHTWVALTLTIKDFAETHWPALGPTTRLTYLTAALDRATIATGTTDDLLHTLLNHGTTTDDYRLAELTAAALDLHNPDTRTAHHTLIALTPGRWPTTLRQVIDQIATHQHLPLYRNYTPGTDEPITTQTAAGTPTHTIHTQNPIRTRNPRQGWRPWTPGHPVHPHTVTPYLAHIRTRRLTYIRLQHRDPDGNVLDEA